MARQNGWRRTGHWEWAKQWASLFDGILPVEVCEAAMATCRLSLRDKDSTAAGGAWGFAVLTFMQTFGHEPGGIVTQIRKAHNWVTLQAAESADVILGCFGLTLADVIDHYGMPEEGEKIDLDLCELVTAIAPDFAVETEAAVA